MLDYVVAHNIITRVLIEEGGREETQRQRDLEDATQLALKVEEGAQNKAMRLPLEARKGKKEASLLELPEETP